MSNFEAGEYTSKQTVEATGINENLYKDLFKFRGGERPILDTRPFHERITVPVPSKGRGKARKNGFLEVFVVFLYDRYQHYGFSNFFLQSFYDTAKVLYQFTEKEIDPTHHFLSTDYKRVHKESLFLLAKGRRNKRREAYRELADGATGYQVDWLLEIACKDKEAELRLVGKEVALKKARTGELMPIAEHEFFTQGHKFSDKRYKFGQLREGESVRMTQIYWSPLSNDFYLTINLSSLKEGLLKKMKAALS